MSDIDAPQTNRPNREYFVYLLKYLGVAMISGSVVHAGTLTTGFTRYVVLGAIGLLMMIIGNALEAKMKGETLNFNYFFVITALSLATGFLSGGIQHYFDNPIYAGGLLALGIFFSYIFFFKKEKFALNTKHASMAMLFSAAFFAFSYYAMPQYAAEMGHSHGDAGHSHGDHSHGDHAHDKDHAQDAKEGGHKH